MRVWHPISHARLGPSSFVEWPARRLALHLCRALAVSVRTNSPRLATLCQMVANRPRRTTARLLRSSVRRDHIAAAWLQMAQLARRRPPAGATSEKERE